MKLSYLKLHHCLRTKLKPKFTWLLVLFTIKKTKIYVAKEKFRIQNLRLEARLQNEKVLDTHSTQL